MKKAKIMLSAIAVVGIAGGVMAFNAKTGTHAFTGTAKNSCVAATFTTTTDNTQPFRYTGVSATNCAVETYILVGEQ